MQDGDKREIIIIRRRPDDHEGDHHGGVWKIAYADFMTAMMAFFLVMWLISATDSHAKKAIAHYFNPIKLVEATDDRKGIRDPQNSSNATEPSPDAQVDPNAARPETVGPLPGDAKGQTPKSSGPADRSPSSSEGRLFQDPYAVLSDLAKNASKEALHPDFAPDGDKTRSGRNGLTGGTEFRDPFDPVYWKAARSKAGAGTGRDGGAAARIDRMTTPDAGLLSGAAEAETGGSAEAEAKPATARAAPEAKTEVASIAPASSAVAEAAAEPGRDQKSARTKSDEASEPADAAAAILSASDPASDAASVRRAGEAAAETLGRQIGEALGRARPDRPRLEVVAGKDGVLISLMDNAKGAMFAIGSAEPKPDLVVEMARIGAILAKQKGQVVIGGHTDARPFHNAAYDNWRLSSARAQMAFYMLVRGGLPEGRVERVEGYADRRPKIATEPNADANRRIEILLRREETP